MRRFYRWAPVAIGVALFALAITVLALNFLACQTPAILATWETWETRETRWHSWSRKCLG